MELLLARSSSELGMSSVEGIAAGARGGIPEERLIGGGRGGLVGRALQSREGPAGRSPGPPSKFSPGLPSKLKGDGSGTGLHGRSPEGPRRDPPSRG